MDRALLALCGGFIGTIGAFHLRAWSERRTMVRTADHGPLAAYPSRRYRVEDGRPGGDFRRPVSVPPVIDVPFAQRRHPSVDLRDPLGAQWAIAFLTARWFGLPAPWEAFMDDPDVSTHDLVERLVSEELEALEQWCRMARADWTVEQVLQQAGVRAQTQRQV